MIDTYDRAQKLKQKMKHIGLDENDHDEVRMLLNDLMTLSEVVGLHSHLSFDQTEEGWTVLIKSPIDRFVKNDLMLLLSGG